VLTIVALIFIGDLVVLTVTERLWQHRFGVWTEILFDDVALSAFCAAFLVPLVRGWQRRARVAERAMDIASDGFIVAAADGQVLRVNDGYCTMTGLERDVLMRARLHDLPVDTALPPLDEHLALVKQQGMARIDTQHRRAQGDALDVQVTTAWLPDLRCFAGFIRDDSDRVRAASELKQSAQRLQDTFELAPVGMTRSTPDGRFLQVNSAYCDMLGLSRDELLALGPGELTLPDDRLADQAQLQQMLSGQSARYTVEKRLRRPDGVLVWVLEAVALVPDEAGLPDYLISVTKDIGARKQAEAALRAAEVALRANAAKTEFLSRMSHELRTPLNAVLGFSQLLQMDSTRPLTAGQAQQVRHIELAGQHLLALINDVLDLSRIESGRLTLSTDEVILRSVAEEAIAMVSAMAADRGVVLRLEPIDGEQSARVRADRVRLKQVLINLLSNAIKYNRPGGTATLGWRGGLQGWEIHVTDTGQGMSEVQLAHLFEPFNRLGAERSGVDGTGIGLTLSRHLVDLMGGRLSVNSLPGQGTVVILWLPQASPTTEPDQFISSPVPLPRPGRALRVLYAEDNEVNVELVRQAVRSRPGIELRIATNGAEALSMARNDVPDLMLVDMHLGDTTGLELGQVLRGDPRTARIRLVALSADALPEQIRRALSKGFEAYLTKPVDVSALLGLLDAAAGG
jgi:PAS domain S-box-containing protein